MNAPERLSLTLSLPVDGGRLEPFGLSEPRGFPARTTGAFNRIAYSAAEASSASFAAGARSMATKHLRSWPRL